MGGERVVPWSGAHSIVDSAECFPLCTGAGAAPPGNAVSFGACRRGNWPLEPPRDSRNVYREATGPVALLSSAVE